MGANVFLILKSCEYRNKKNSWEMRSRSGSMPPIKVSYCFLQISHYYVDNVTTNDMGWTKKR